MGVHDAGHVYDATLASKKKGPALMPCNNRLASGRAMGIFHSFLAAKLARFSLWVYNDISFNSWKYLSKEYMEATTKLG